MGILYVMTPYKSAILYIFAGQFRPPPPYIIHHLLDASAL